MVKSSWNSPAAVVRSMCAMLIAIGTMHSSAAQDVSTTSAQTGDTARIRFFGQNGIFVEFYQNSTCIGGSGMKERVSGGMGDAFSSFIGRIKNTSIGMQHTPTIDNLNKRDGFVSKAYFREYEIPANQPIALRMNYNAGPGLGVSCGDIGGTFIPESGKDYEAGLNFRPGGCYVALQEIQQDNGGTVTLRDTPLAPVLKCN